MLLMLTLGARKVAHHHQVLKHSALLSEGVRTCALGWSWGWLGDGLGMDLVAHGGESQDLLCANIS